MLLNSSIKPYLLTDFNYDNLFKYFIEHISNNLQVESFVGWVVRRNAGRFETKSKFHKTNKKKKT